MKYLARILPFAALLALSISSASAKDFRVGLVLDKGGRDDKSFNNAAYNGVMKAQKDLSTADLKIQVKYVEATDDNAFEPLLRALAQKNYDIILAIGVSQAEAVGKVSKEFPNAHFAIVDAEVNAPNVASLMFEEHEGSYVVGAIAAMASKTGKIGFIGGMDIPLIRRFEMGFKAGMLKINPKATLTSNFVGVTGDAWNNPAKGKELAKSQYGAGIDVIFAAAGATNNGVLDAAEESKKFVIGVDSNQNWIKPGLVLTSMLKRVDLAVFEEVKSVRDSKFKGGLKRFGLKDQGIDYAVDQYNEKVCTPDMRKKADELKKQIIAGKIQVPDFYKKK